MLGAFPSKFMSKMPLILRNENIPITHNQMQLINKITKKIIFGNNNLAEHYII